MSNAPANHDSSPQDIERNEVLNAIGSKWSKFSKHELIRFHLVNASRALPEAARRMRVASDMAPTSLAWQARGAALSQHHRSDAL
jgi:hypothetical protein